MKRIIVIVCLALVGVMSLTAGVREDFKANPKLSANNYQAYPVDGFPAITPAPAGWPLQAMRRFSSTITVVTAAAG